MREITQDVEKFDWKKKAQMRSYEKLVNDDCGKVRKGAVVKTQGRKGAVMRNKKKGGVLGPMTFHSGRRFTPNMLHSTHIHLYSYPHYCDISIY